MLPFDKMRSKIKKNKRKPSQKKSNKKSKKRLASLFVAGFKKPNPPVKRKKPTLKKRKHSSFFNWASPSPSEIPQKNPSIEETLPDAPSTLEALPQVQKNDAPILSLVPHEPQLVPPEPIVPSLSGKAFLSTADITQPNDQLKQSIEAFLLDQRSPHTRRAYGKDLLRFVKFLHSRNFRQGPASLTRTVLIGYKESLIADGLQHTSIDRHLATLRSFFKWLVDDGILEKSPAEGVRFLNPKKLSTTIGFSDEEVRKILMIPDLHKKAGSQHYAILMVLFYCGLRRSELCELKTSNLGTERNHRVLRLRGKGNAERLIVLTQPVWNALKHYFYITGRSLEKLGSDDYLFSPLRNNRTGVLNKPLDPSMIFYIVTRYAKLAGIMNRVSPHSCRATAISNARDHNVPDRAIQEFAGWASPDMITRYDKRKTSIEESATHAIRYGSENRNLPQLSVLSQEEPRSSQEKTDPSENSPKKPEELDQLDPEPPGL
ncbi:MAG: tyrosine-type recombinase/integrase [Bdellovibrionia bacterium]